MKAEQLISHERTQECVVEQPVDVAVPLVVLPIWQKSWMLCSCLRLVCTSKSASSSRAWISVEQSVPPPHIETVEAVRSIPRGRVHLDGPEETVEVVTVVPREREQQRTAEQAEVTFVSRVRTTERCGSRDCRSVSRKCGDGAGFGNGLSHGDSGCARCTCSSDDGAGNSGSRVNECNSELRSKLWRCPFHKLRRTVSKRSENAPHKQFPERFF